MAVLLAAHAGRQQFGRDNTASAQQAGHNSISDCVRQIVRPVINSLHRNTYGYGNIAHRAAKQIDCVLLLHAAIKAYFMQDSKFSLFFFARMLVWNL